MSNGYPDPFHPAHELAEAVASSFLTQEEARLVYWSQFYALKQAQWVAAFKRKS